MNEEIILRSFLPKEEAPHLRIINKGEQARKEESFESFVDRIFNTYPLETIKAVLNKNSFETSDGHIVSITSERQGIVGTWDPYTQTWRDE